MFKWLSKLWKRGSSEGQNRSTGPLVIDYGQYQHKPVIARALSVVIGVSQSELCAWVANPAISVYLNDELLQGAQWARRRLESGQYEVKISTQDKIWRFFIG